MNERRAAGRGAVLFACLLFASALGGIWLSLQPAHPEADVTHYKLWSRLVTRQGVGATYSGEYPETYAIYPPVTMYGLWLVGNLYQASVDPEFDRERALESQWLTTAIRVMALVFHLALGSVLFALLRSPAGERSAAIGAGLYLLNPGALWNIAVWGQPDSWHSLFLLLGVWSIMQHHAAGAGGWFALAALTKPQAWALLPLAGVALLRSGGSRSALPRLAVGGLAGGLMAVLVLLPFLLSGTFRDLLTLPGRISSVMPVASANAHNLWWLATRGATPFVFDSQRISGPLALSYRQVALALLLAMLIFTAWRIWRAREAWELPTTFAYAGFAWFFFTTSAHENHAFMIFPLLCLVYWRSRFLTALLLFLIVSFSYNVIGHDSSVAPLLDQLLGPWSLRLQMIASALNLLVLAAWTAWEYPRAK